MAFRLERGDFNKLGTKRCGGSVTFTFSVKRKAPTQILLYDRHSKELSYGIELSDEFRMGRMYSVTVEGLDWDNLCYLYSLDGAEFLDPYAAKICGREKWMDESRQADGYRVYGGFTSDRAWPEDWDDDSCPEVAPCDTIIYKLHMRGFTMDHKLHADKKGNYKGIIDRIPELLELGVTSLEFMPIYEFEEVRFRSHKVMEKSGETTTVVEEPYATNYWGFGEGSYFAPKASYFGGEYADCHMRQLVQFLHNEGLEIIMEIAFTGEESDDFIMAVLLYWRREYHIDGFHIVGVGLPSERIADDPFLGESKIFYDSFPDDVLYGEEEDKHLFVYNDSFVYPMRKLQHHMDGSMADFAGLMRRQGEHFGYVNYAASNTGFCLIDAYSYGEKHNIDNGEDNADGSNYNCSYNHGVEGSTPKKNINRQRRIYARTALTSVLLSQGIPMIYAGDEVLNSQSGNNNPYCQDNSVGWTNFSKKKSSQQFREYIRHIIQFRNEHPVIHCEEPMHENDYRSFGFPDLSYHGREPWVMGIGAEKKAIGIYYSGYYGPCGPESDILLCFNFYYGEETFACPTPGSGHQWYFVTNTADEEYVPATEPLDNQSQIIVPPGTITILEGR